MAVTINTPKVNRICTWSLSDQPQIAKINVKITIDAMVIPETGLLEAPIKPAIRAETMTKRNERIIDSRPPINAIIILYFAKKKETTKINTAPSNKSIELNLSPLSPLLLFRALRVSEIDCLIAGISFKAPIIPPPSIIPAPMYFR